MTFIRWINWRPLAPIFTLTATLLAGGPVYGSAPDLFGFGASAVSQVGAVATAPDGYAAVYHNPGALGRGNVPTLSLGYSVGHPDLSIGEVQADATRISALTIGFELPLPLGGWLEERLALGGGFYIPTNTVLYARLPPPGTPHFPVLSHRAQTVTLQAAASIYFAPWLSVGTGFIALSSLDGQIDVAPNAQGRIGAQARDQLVASYAPIVGILSALTTSLDLAVVYRGSSSARFNLPITADLGDGFPVPVPDLWIKGVAQYDPAQWELEMSYVTDRLRVSVNLSRNSWSEYPKPLVYAARPDDIAPLPSPNFQDTWEPAVGIRLDATPTWRLMGGYRYVPTPVAQTMNAYRHLGANRHVSGVGVRWKADGLRLTLAGQGQRLTERESQFDAESVRHGGFIWVANAEIGVEL